MSLPDPEVAIMIGLMIVDYYSLSKSYSSSCARCRPNNGIHGCMAGSELIYITIELGTVSWNFNLCTKVNNVDRKAGPPIFAVVVVTNPCAPRPESQKPLSRRTRSACRWSACIAWAGSEVLTAARVVCGVPAGRQIAIAPKASSWLQVRPCLHLKNFWISLL